MENNDLSLVVEVIDEATDVIRDISKDIEKISKSIDRHLSRLQGSMNSLTGTVSKNMNTVNSTVDRGMGRLHNTVQKSISGINKIISGLFVVALGLFSEKLVETGAEVETIARRMNLVFEENSLSIKQWAEGLQKALDIDAVGLMKDISQIGVLLKGYGVGGQALEEMSKSLSLLVKDFSALYGYSEDVVFEKLMSGIRGETEAIEDLGINLKSSALQEVAYSVGIKKKVAEMNNAERAYLNYIAIMQQSSIAQGQFVAQQDSTSARLNKLKTSITSLMRVIGQIAAEIFNRISGLLIGLIEMINGVVVKVADALNIQVGLDDKQFKGSEDGLGKVVDKTEDVKEGIEGIGKEAKKAEGSLASFDKIITLNKGKDKDDDSGSTGGNVFSDVDIPELDWGIEDKLGKEVDNSKLKVEEIPEKIKESMEKVGTTIDELGKNITGRADFSIGFDGAKAYDDIVSTIENIKGIFKGIGKFVIELGFKIADDLDIGTLLNDAIGLVESATGTLQSAIDNLTPGFQKFYDTALAPIVDWLGEKLHEALTLAQEELDEFADWFKDIGPDFEEFCELLGGVVDVVWEFIEPFLDTAWDMALLVIDGLLQGFRDFIGFLLEHKEATVLVLSTIAGAIAGLKIGGMITDIGNLIVKCGGVGPAIASIISKAVGPLGGALKGLFAIIAANPIAMIVGAVVGLVVGFIALYKNSEEFRAVVDKLWEKLKAFGSFILNVFKGVVLAAFDSIKEKVTYVINNMKQIFSGIITFIKGVFSGDWKKAWSGIVDVFTGLFKNIVAPIRTPLNLIIDLVNKVIEGFNGLKIEVPDWVPGIGGQSWGMNIPKIPKLATGGILDKSTVVNVGEAGAEAVIPLKASSPYFTPFVEELGGVLSEVLLGVLDNVKGGGGSQTVNYNFGTVLGGQAGAREIKRMLDKLKI